MVSLRKTNFVGEVSVTEKSSGGIVGTAKMEKLRSGTVVAHVAIYPGYENLLETGGFKIGSFVLPEE